MQKQIASSATIILLFAVIAVVATTSLQHASALITSTSSSPTQTGSSLPPLTLVNPAGTAYIDTFSDGTKTYSFPGDPTIDSHFHEANAPIPKRPGLTWTGSQGYDAYNTPSGKLEIGDYTQQADGTYLVHLPAQTYTDATSTSQWPDRYVVMTSDPTATPAPAFSPAPTPPTAAPTTTTTTSTPTTAPTTSTTTEATSAPTTSPTTSTQATSTQ